MVDSKPPTLISKQLHENKNPAKKTHRIPRHASIHPQRKIPISVDIDIQAVGLVTPASLVGRNLGLAVILRVPRRTGVDNLDDDGSVDLVGGGRAVGADVVDAVAGAAFYGRGGAGRRDVVGGWILAAVCCAGRGGFGQMSNKRKILHQDSGNGMMFVTR